MTEALQIRKNVGRSLSEYSRANVAGLLVASGQTAISYIPVCTSQFFDLLDRNNSTGRGERRLQQSQELARLYRFPVRRTR